MKPSTVYFSGLLNPTTPRRLFRALGVTLPGKVGVKVHSGEVGNQNFLRPAFWKPTVDAVSGTVIECNTAYEGARNTTAAHLETLKLHGWSDAFSVDLLDAEGETCLPIPNGKAIKQNFVGARLSEYDSLLVLSHFKGHPMGGFGGALKNIAIGLASSHGKAYIHGVGDPDAFWTSDHDSFLRAMADAASSIMEMYRGRIAFVNVMCNMSVDCDCCAVAKDPEIADIGVLASTDPVALDRACVDLVYASPDPGKASLIERMESLHGILTVEAAEELGIGTTNYTLQNLD